MWTLGVRCRVTRDIRHESSPPPQLTSSSLQSLHFINTSLQEQLQPLHYDPPIRVVRIMYTAPWEKCLEMRAVG